MALGLVSQLQEKGFSFFTGVPCRLLMQHFEVLEKNTELSIYIPALREDNAIGLAVGATLSGKKSSVLMQNSGLAVSLNALASLVIPFGIPLLLIISIRGYRSEKDAPENDVMGRITLNLLRDLNIKSKVFHEYHTEDIVRWASDLIESGECVAILII